MVSPETGVLLVEIVSVADEIGSRAFVCSRFSFDASGVCSVDFAARLKFQGSDGSGFASIATGMGVDV